VYRSSNLAPIVAYLAEKVKRFFCFFYIIANRCDFGLGFVACQHQDSMLDAESGAESIPKAIVSMPVGCRAVAGLAAGAGMGWGVFLLGGCPKIRDIKGRWGRYYTMQRITILRS
jgi:hypothetical protein